MTPLTLQLALPAVQLVGAVLVGRRISWRKHPALIAYLVSEALGTLLVTAFPSLKPYWTCGVQIPVRTAVVLEVLTFARMAVERPVPAICSALGLSIGAAALAHQTRLEQLYLARQYYLLILCAALVAVVIRRAIWPVLECARHRIYRLGITAWLGVIAIAGTFVKNGLAYRVFPYDKTTWEAASIATYAVLTVVVGAMCLAMVNLPKKIPAKVQKAIAVRFTRRIAA